VVIEKVHKLGGTVLSDEESDVFGLVLNDLSVFNSSPRPRFTDKDLKELDLSIFSVIVIMSRSVSDATLVHLESAPRLTSLDLFYPAITDQGLKRLLRKQRGIVDLKVFAANVTDDSLEEIGALPHLASLSLARTKVTNAGLRRLGRLKQLESLSLAQTAVSDPGLRHITGLKNLRFLDLDQTAVTDAGVPQLKELTSLERLRLRSTKVTTKGEERLREYLPSLKILREEFRVTPAPFFPIKK
jgi:hypothetical protein